MPAPVIDAAHANRGWPSSIANAALQRSQEGVLALGHAQARYQPPSRASTGGVGHQTRQIDDATRPASVWLSHRRQAIAEGLPGTFGVRTPAPRQLEPEEHRGSLRRQVL